MMMAAVRSTSFVFTMKKLLFEGDAFVHEREHIATGTRPHHICRRLPDDREPRSP